MANIFRNHFLSNKDDYAEAGFPNTYEIVINAAASTMAMMAWTSMGKYNSG